VRRILHVITGLETGGAETALSRLLEALGPPHFEHLVLALGGEGTLSARVRSTGAALVHLNMKPGAPSPWAVLNLRRWMRRFKPDVVHGWMYHANLMASLASLGTGLPVLWGIRQSLYDLEREKPTTRMVIRSCRMLSQFPARTVYNSSVSARQHQTFGFRSTKSLIVPNGFDISEFRPDKDARERIRLELSIDTSALAIGLFARWHSMKDHANFLRAAALFVKHYRDCVLLLAGSGMDQGNLDLMALVDEHGLANNLRLCGRRSDMAALNSALDIATSSSWSEAFPNALGEAMACGVPCVATDVGDAREILGDTGVVVPPRDPQALCAGWNALVSLTEPARLAMGSRARQRIAERYSLGAMSSRYAATYADVSKGS